jgi:hypothetical protein
VFLTCRWSFYRRSGQEAPRYTGRKWQEVIQCLVLQLIYSVLPSRGAATPDLGFAGRSRSLEVSNGNRHSVSHTVPFLSCPSLPPSTYAGKSDNRWTARLHQVSNRSTRSEGFRRKYWALWASLASLASLARDRILLHTVLTPLHPHRCSRRHPRQHAPSCAVGSGPVRFIQCRPDYQRPRPNIRSSPLNNRIPVVADSPPSSCLVVNSGTLFLGGTVCLYLYELAKPHPSINSPIMTTYLRIFTLHIPRRHQPPLSPRPSHPSQRLCDLLCTLPPLPPKGSLPRRSWFLRPSPLHLHVHDRLKGHLRRHLVCRRTGHVLPPRDQPDGTQDVLISRMGPQHQTRGAVRIRSRSQARLRRWRSQSSCTHIDLPRLFSHYRSCTLCRAYPGGSHCRPCRRDDCPRLLARFDRLKSPSRSHSNGSSPASSEPRTPPKLDVTAGLTPQVPPASVCTTSAVPLSKQPSIAQPVHVKVASQHPRSRTKSSVHLCGTGEWLIPLDPLPRGPSPICIVQRSDPASRPLGVIYVGPDLLHPWSSSSSASSPPFPSHDPGNEVFGWRHNHLPSALLSWANPSASSSRSSRVLDGTQARLYVGSICTGTHLELPVRSAIPNEVRGQ